MVFDIVITEDSEQCCANSRFSGVCVQLSTAPTQQCYVANLKLARVGEFLPWKSANAANQGFLPSYQSWLLNIYQYITAPALAKIRRKGSCPEGQRIHAKKRSYLDSLPFPPQSHQADSCNQNINRSSHLKRGNTFQL